MMHRECPYCGALHTGEFVEDVEEAVLRCYDQRGGPEGPYSLQAWGSRETLPVPETIRCAP